MSDEVKAFIKYCQSVLESCETIEEVLIKLNRSMRDNK